MNTDINHDYYEILEVPQNATQQEIAVAYQKAKRTYSAQNPALYTIFDKSEADQLQNMIDEAFAVLGNDTYRNIYEKRRQANFEEKDLSIDAIKTAGMELFGQNIVKKSVEPIVSSSYQVDKDFEKVIENQTQWNGDFLRQVREYKKVSVESLNDKTKINTWYIHALEKMDANNLPAPVFVRGYIIQIARSLYLDDKVVADSYMKLYKKALEN